MNCLLSNAMNKLSDLRASSSAYQINDDCLRVVCWLMRVPVKATRGQNLFFFAVYIFGLISLIFLSVNYSFSFQDLKLQGLNRSVHF